MRRLFLLFGATLALAGACHGAVQETIIITDAPSNGADGSELNGVATGTAAGGYALGRVTLSGTLTRVTAPSWASDARVRVIAPNGAFVDLTPFPNIASFTSLSFSGSCFVATGQDPAGEWTVRFFEAIDDGGPAVDAEWDLTISLTDDAPTAPSATNLGVVDEDGESVLNAPIGVGGVVWIRFEIGCGVTDASGRFLDIDTFGSLLPGLPNEGVPPNDTQIALFDDAGSLVASDDDSGEGSVSALSFGSTIPRAPNPVGGNGAALSGQNGALAPGVYYLAVAVYRAEFASSFWGVTAESTQVGTVSVNFSSNIPIGCDQGCAGDANGDLIVDFDDISSVLGEWLTDYELGTGTGDANGDGSVDFDDLVAVLAHWLESCD